MVRNSMSSTVIIISIAILATIINKSIRLGFYNFLAFFWIYCLIGIFIYNPILCLIISIVLLTVILAIDSAKYKILKERFQYEDLFCIARYFAFLNFISLLSEQYSSGHSRLVYYVRPD